MLAAAAAPAGAQYDEAAAHHVRPWGSVSLGIAPGGGGTCGQIDCFPVAPAPASLAAGVRFPVSRTGALGTVWAGVGGEATSFVLPLSSNPTPRGWLVLGRVGVTGAPGLSVEGGAGRFTYGTTAGRRARVGVRLQYGPAFGFVTAIRMAGVRPDNNPGEGPTPFRPRLLVVGAGLGF